MTFHRCRSAPKQNRVNFHLKQCYHDFLLRHCRASTQASPKRSKSMNPKSLKPLWGAKIAAVLTKNRSRDPKIAQKCSSCAKSSLGKRLEERSSTILRAVAVSDRFCTRKIMIVSWFLYCVFLRENYKCRDTCVILMQAANLGKHFFSIEKTMIFKKSRFFAWNDFGMSRSKNTSKIQWLLKVSPFSQKSIKKWFPWDRFCM